jgi:hypothetical protein
MAGNANLMIKIGGDSAGFRRSVDESKLSLDDLSAHAVKIGASIAAAMAAAGAAMISLSTSATAAAQELTTLAQVSNTGTVEFQKLAAASKTVGIEQDKLADIYKDINDRVGEFLTTGSGPMVDFFTEVAPLVGVTAEQFRNLSGPQALQLFASSMEAAGLNAQQMIFHMEAMAGDSSKLLPLLAQNGEKMRELGEAAAKIPGRIMPAEDVAELAAANQRWVEIKDNMQGIVNSVAPEITKFLLGVTDILRDGAEWAAKWLDNLRADDIANKLTRQKELSEQLAQIEEKLNETFEQRKQIIIENNARAQSMSGHAKEQEALAFRIYEKEQEALQAQKERVQELIKELGIKKEITTAEVTNTAPPTGLPQPELIGEETKVPPSVLAEWEASEQIRIATLERYAFQKDAATLHEEEMAALRDSFFVTKQLTEQQYQEATGLAEREHQKRLMNEVKNGNNARQAFEQLTLKNKTKMVLGQMQEMTAGVADQNKTLFNINKAAAIGDAIMNGFAGVSKTLATYPFPFNIAMAALHGVAAVAQVQKIRSTQYGSASGGGSFTPPTGGGGSSAAAAQAAAPAAQSGGAQQNRSTLFVEGLNKDALFSGDAVAGLAAKLLDFQKNGGQVVLGA